MPITRTVGGARVDSTALTPFSKDASGVAATGAFQTILSINGKGFLESFHAIQNASGAGFLLRITADGIVKANLGTAQSRVVGIVNKNDIRPTATAGQSAVTAPNTPQFTTVLINALKSYPTTDGTDGIILLGDSKIWFTQSLLLEISCLATNTISYHYDGGYQ